VRWALTFTISDGRITAYEVIADPARLAALDVAILD
jgi:RNA polymerase sigma-70 factor (ECF subfamily)